jgi:hypothetical protein
MFSCGHNDASSVDQPAMYIGASMLQHRGVEGAVLFPQIKLNWRENIWGAFKLIFLLNMLVLV